MKFDVIWEIGIEIEMLFMWLTDRTDWNYPLSSKSIQIIRNRKQDGSAGGAKEGPRLYGGVGVLSGLGQGTRHGLLPLPGRRVSLRPSPFLPGGGQQEEEEEGDWELLCHGGGAAFQ